MMRRSILRLPHCNNFLTLDKKQLEDDSNTVAITTGSDNSVFQGDTLVKLYDSCWIGEKQSKAHSITVVTTKGSDNLQ